MLWIRGAAIGNDETPIIQDCDVAIIAFIEDQKVEFIEEENLGADGVPPHNEPAEPEHEPEDNEEEDIELVPDEPADYITM